jgi:hypothetical protein
MFIYACPIFPINWCPEQYKDRILNENASNVKSRTKLNSNKDSDDSATIPEEVPNNRYIMQTNVHNATVNVIHNHIRFTDTCISRVEPTSSEAQDRDADGNAISQKKRTDITEITDNEVIHGDVTIAQTQATTRLTQPCKLLSNNATKNPDPRNTCPSTAFLPIRYAQYKVLNDKEKVKHTKYSNISDINNPNNEIKLSFHAIVATVNGTVNRSALNFFTAVVTADTDSLFKNREDTLRAKTRDMILRCAYRRLQRIQFQAPTVYHHSAQKKRKRNE